MKTLNTASRERVSEQVFALLKSANITSYPVSFRSITCAAVKREFGIEFDTYQNFEQFKPGAREILGTNDGVSIYFADGGFYMVLYNAGIAAQPRINWTIAHEIGHILLGHTRNRLRGGDIERQADMFARLLICHPLILAKCRMQSADEVQKLCRVSRVTSQRCEAEFKAGSAPGYNKWDYLIADIFAGFTGKKRCAGCKNIETGLSAPGDAKFCGRCGGEEFERGLDVFLEDMPGRILKCPVCRNQDLSESRFCKICGFDLRNLCTECKKPAYLPALFCPYCKSRTELAQRTL